MRSRPMPSSACSWRHGKSLPPGSSSCRSCCRRRRRCLRWIVNDILSGTLFINIALTLYRTFAGFLLAAVVGVVIGILMTRMVSVRWFFDPILSFGLPLPKVALLPVFMLWFGLFDASEDSDGRVLRLLSDHRLDLAWHARRRARASLVGSLARREGSRDPMGNRPAGRPAANPDRPADCACRSA